MKRQTRGPVQPGFWSLNHAQRRSVPAGVSPVDRDGGRSHLSGTGQRLLHRPIALEQLAFIAWEELMERSIVRYEHHIILQVDSDSVWVGQQRVIALEEPDWRFISFGHFVVHDHGMRVLDRQVKILPCLVDDDAGGSRRTAPSPIPRDGARGLTGTESRTLRACRT